MLITLAGQPRNFYWPQILTRDLTFRLTVCGKVVRCISADMILDVVLASSKFVPEWPDAERPGNTYLRSQARQYRIQHQTGTFDETKMEKRYQVFLSSTFKDLIKERDEVTKTILSLNCFVAGMERFFALDEKVFEYIKRVIDDSDYYLLIIGGCYGSTDKKGISYTEREFDYAVSTDKHIIALLIDDDVDLPVSKTERSNKKVKNLKEFRRKVSNPDIRMVDYWKDASDLQLKTYQALSNAFRLAPQTGWVRADMPAGIEILNEVNELRKQKDELEKELGNYKAIMEDSAHTDIATLDEICSFTVHIDSGNEYLGTYKRVSVLFKETWRTLFAHLAPKFIVKRTETAMKQYIRSVVNLLIGKRKPIRGSLSLPTDIYDTICLQFNSLGLLDIVEIQIGGKFIPHYVLSKIGDDLMRMERVIKPGSQE